MVSPIESIERLIEYCSTAETMVAHSPEEYFELMDPFLTNPERHRAHVRQIARVGGSVLSLRMVLGSIPFARFMMARVHRAVLHILID